MHTFCLRATAFETFVIICGMPSSSPSKFNLYTVIDHDSNIGSKLSPDFVLGPTVPALRRADDDVHYAVFIRMVCRSRNRMDEDALSCWRQSFSGDHGSHLGRVGSVCGLGLGSLSATPMVFEQRDLDRYLIELDLI